MRKRPEAATVVKQLSGFTVQFLGKMCEFRVRGKCHDRLSEVFDRLSIIFPLRIKFM